MKIVFAGSPEIAVPSLEKAVLNFDIVAVLTNPDKVTGRGQKIKFNPVKTKALELDLNIIQPEKLGIEARNQIAALNHEVWHH